MKNLLSENMLRFGTKNLSESQKRALTLESILQTINEHGLAGEVRQRLSEAVGTHGELVSGKGGVNVVTPNTNTVQGMISPGRYPMQQIGSYENGEVKVTTKNATFILATNQNTPIDMYGVAYNVNRGEVPEEAAKKQRFFLVVNADGTFDWQNNLGKRFNAMGNTATSFVSGYSGTSRQM